LLCSYQSKRQLLNNEEEADRRFRNVIIRCNEVLCAHSKFLVIQQSYDSQLLNLMNLNFLVSYGCSAGSY
jgi:hypothetical protein